MYFSVLLTIMVLQIPLLDGLGLRALLMKALFELTHWTPFLVLNVIINLVIIGMTYCSTSLSIYLFFKKRKLTLE